MIEKYKSKVMKYGNNVMCPPPPSPVSRNAGRVVIVGRLSQRRYGFFVDDETQQGGGGGGEEDVCAERERERRERENARESCIIMVSAETSTEIQLKGSKNYWKGSEFFFCFLLFASAVCCSSKRLYCVGSLPFLICFRLNVANLLENSWNLLCAYIAEEIK